MSLLIFYILLFCCSLACEAPVSKEAPGEIVNKNINNWNFEQADTLSLQNWLAAKQGILNQVYQSSDKYRLEIILTKIKKDTNGNRQVSHYSFRNHPDVYRNPASTIKLPTALLALEKFSSLADKGIQIGTQFQVRGLNNSCSPTLEKQSLQHTVVMALSVSDDHAYNTLFDFAGTAYLNRRLPESGYPKARILQKFHPSCSLADCRMSPDFVFMDESGKELFQVSGSRDTNQWTWPRIDSYKIGKAYLNANNKLIPEPRNFYGSNLLALEDLHRMMACLFLPEYFEPAHRFRLNPAADSLVKWALRVKPSQTSIQKLSKAPYHDAYTSYFFCGNKPQNSIPEYLEVYNVVGQSHGFLSESAFIVNTQTQETLILSAALYVNQDGIINDGKYEYQTIGFPFLKTLSWDILSFP